MPSPSESLIDLAEPIICPECQTIYMQIIEELHEKSPVHCRECGAFMCTWDQLAKRNGHKRDGAV